MIYAVIGLGGNTSQALDDSAPNKRAMLPVPLYDPNGLIVEVAASGDFRMKKGLYRITGQAPAYQVNNHQTAIYKNGAQAYFPAPYDNIPILGSMVYSGATENQQAISVCIGYLLVESEDDVYALMHAVELSNPSTDAGGYAAFNPFGGGQVFAGVTVEVIGGS